MEAVYDFTESRPNPYVPRARKQVTMNIDVSTIEYFKEESARTGVPYQTIMNMFLGQCAREQQHLVFS